MEKLIIQKAGESVESTEVIRVSRTSKAIINDIAKRTNRSHIEISEAMLIFAAKHIQITDTNEEVI
ncbi:hypothetical protein [Culicoidibacter larvae]|uniref:Uncharacterized protein n=1 Tax=Culicoidibacter larvae TaxID=2579976 RepID=A0A5R8Q8P1_9FIRM|nr:hypothetical protein [Culicoidibacter larvae]TLG72084.1 hypothetical protein FEZ08_09635 [Culicoidibacter larvae]